MVRSVMAALVLVIVPGFVAGQELALGDPARATLEEVVHFDYDEVTITAEAEQLLRVKVPILSSGTTIGLRLEGHADERGLIEHNLALGSRRAESVREFLAALGVSAEQLTTTSLGKERPLVNRSDEGAWAQNRRVEFVITSVSGPTLAGGDPIIVGGDVPIVVGGDPRALVVSRPERTLVGDVEVDPPPPGEVQPSLVRTRPNLERDRRSRFYRDPFAAPDVRGGTNRPGELWVPRSATWSATWLGPARSPRWSRPAQGLPSSNSGRSTSCMG